MKIKKNITILLLVISLFVSSMTVYSIEHLTLGSTKQEVLKVLGTPDEINSSFNWWYYGNARISFDHKDQIIEYTNAKALKISLTEPKKDKSLNASAEDTQLKPLFPSSYETLKTPKIDSKSNKANGYGEISSTTGRPKTVHVNGYYRKDGTYVKPHYRSSPRKK